MKVVAIQSRIEKMFAAGLTDDQIAELTGYKKATVENYRSRLGLVRPKPQYCKPLGLKAETSPPPPIERPNPMVIAMNWLGHRLVEKPSGYWLDGRPVNLAHIMQEVNRMHVASGCEQFGPPGWRV